MLLVFVPSTIIPVRLLIDHLGFIGGAVLTQVYDAHPEYDFTLFVRDEERSKPLSARYPDVKFVYGTLNDSAVIEKAAAEADVVIR